MMGQLSSGQERLFYSFNLEDHIPANHLLRSIDRCLDLSDLRHHLADFYSPIGRPSIDPELMIRMLIVGYCYGIRSERRLCEEAHLNLAYRWFCRLSLEDEVPNHSTFSKNRHGRFRDSDLFRWLFNEVLRRCMDAGLVKGEGFAVDASIIKADASRQRGVPGDEPVNWSDPALSTRAVREYFEALDEEALAETLPKRLSLTDPQARWTAAPGGPAFYAYSTNYLIDTEHGVIMDVEPTPAHRTAEVESTKTMIDRVEAQFDIKPERLIGDTAYGTAPMLAWMVEEKDIEPHVPVWDKTERKNDSFSSNDFRWNEETEEYAARLAMHYVANGEPSRTSVRTSPKPTPSSSDPDRLTARRVRWKPSAARTRRFARSLAAFMKPLVTWLDTSRRRRSTCALATNVRRSKCCSPTSSASLNWIACDYVA